jgi:hypothetical protein
MINKGQEDTVLRGELKIECQSTFKHPALMVAYWSERAIAAVLTKKRVGQVKRGNSTHGYKAHDSAVADVLVMGEETAVYADKASKMSLRIKLNRLAQHRKYWLHAATGL